MIKLRFIQSRRFLCGLTLLLGLTISTPARPVAEEANSSVEIVNHFYTVLLDTMKEAKTLGFKGRYTKLEPAIEHTFNLPLMTRFSIGPQWNNISAEQQAKLVEAFRRYTVATYASRFDDFDGEHFETAPLPIKLGDRLIVTSKLVTRSGDPVELNYLTSRTENGWRVIDVYLSGTISELATRRSEFSAVLAHDGVTALLAMIDQKVSDLTPKT